MPKSCSALLACPVADLPGNEDQSVDDFKMSRWKRFRNRNPIVPVPERRDGALPDHPTCRLFVLDSKTMLLV
jgi:hypothetical protein